MPDGQGLDDAILAGVGVLILVDQQVVEAAGLGLAHCGKFREQLFGAEQQVVEVDGPGRLQSAF